MVIRSFLLAWGLLCSGLLLAEPAIRLSFGAGTELAAGEPVVVGFEGIPADVQELEVLLTGGVGRPFRLRVSESLPARTSSFLWTVPNLDLDDTRLVLRMGRAGRETDGATSEPFSIDGSSTVALASLELRGGEVWIELGSSRNPNPQLPRTDLGRRSPSVERSAERPDFMEETTSASAVSETISQSDRRPLPGAPAPRAVSVLSLSRIPLSIPARI